MRRKHDYLWCHSYHSWTWTTISLILIPLDCMVYLIWFLDWLNQNCSHWLLGLCNFEGCPHISLALVISLPQLLVLSNEFPKDVRTSLQSAHVHATITCFMQLFAKACACLIVVHAIITCFLHRFAKACACITSVHAIITCFMQGILLKHTIVYAMISCLV